MKKFPTSAAWGDPMNVVPSLFAEYNSKTASGTPVDLSGRRTTYTKNGTTVRLNPVLSASEAAKYTVENVLGGSDNWRPAKLTEQVSAPVVTIDGSTLKWNDDENAMCWVVFKNDAFYKCVTTAQCDIDSKAKYSVRAANSMGGLGASSNTIDASVTLCRFSPSVAKDNGIGAASGGIYNSSKKTLYLQTDDSRFIKVKVFSLDGKVVLSKNFNVSSDKTGLIEIPLKNITRGFYLIQSETDRRLDKELLYLQ
jgi:hypothetical protein